MQLMKDIRENIIAGTFPQFIRDFMETMYPDHKYPDWAVDALSSVNVKLR